MTFQLTLVVQNFQIYFGVLLSYKCFPIFCYSVHCVARQAVCRVIDCYLYRFVSVWFSNLYVCNTELCSTVNTNCISKCNEDEILYRFLICDKSFFFLLLIWFVSNFNHLNWLSDHVEADQSGISLGLSVL